MEKSIKCFVFKENSLENYAEFFLEFLVEIELLCLRCLVEILLNFHGIISHEFLFECLGPSGQFGIVTKILSCCFVSPFGNRPINLSSNQLIQPSHQFLYRVPPDQTKQRIKKLANFSKGRFKFPNFL
jgi:hypothetical protein